MTTPEGVQITGNTGERYDEVLTAPALAFLAGSASRPRYWPPTRGSL